ncbi:hypothetical protein KY289_008067 [Solanum tuberosum]|nr:hypothetical protein KY289_008067 [Solanum tuberosum]
MNDAWNLFHLHRPHGRVEEILRRSGLYDVVCVGRMHYDYALVIAMVERWRPETHCFHLPFGCCTEDSSMAYFIRDTHRMRLTPADMDGASRVRIHSITGYLRDQLQVDPIGDATPMEQVWCWERILLVQPSAPPPHDGDVLLPYARRWTREIDRNTESHHVLIPFRDQLDRMTKDQDLPAKKRKRDNEDEDGYTRLRPRDVLRISRKGCGT